MDDLFTIHGSTLESRPKIPGHNVDFGTTQGHSVNFGTTHSRVAVTPKIVFFMEAMKKWLPWVKIHVGGFLFKLLRFITDNKTRPPPLGRTESSHFEKADNNKSQSAPMFRKKSFRFLDLFVLQSTRLLRRKMSRLFRRIFTTTFCTCDGKTMMKLI